MDLSKYDQKYIRLTDVWGETFEGMAEHCSAELCLHEYGDIDEDALKIGGYLIYASQIASAEEVAPHGTAELWTEHLVLRRYRPDDADYLYMRFGTDPSTYKYSGWNPYATPEMARRSVQQFIAGYAVDDHTYSWVIDVDDVIVGTIGAYDYTESAACEGGESGVQSTDGATESRIEVGLTIAQDWRGRGFAAEALACVLHHLTENEGINCVTAWCASDNIGSWKAMEKAGMQLVATEKDGLVVGDRTYDKLIYEYRKMS